MNINLYAKREDGMSVISKYTRDSLECRLPLP